MSATDYSVDLRDIRFVLNEQLRIVETLRMHPRHAHLDAETVDSILTGAEQIAREVIAPINAPGDRAGCRFDGAGNVTTPPGYKKAWDTLAEGGWVGLAADEDFGGMGLPYALNVAVGEMLSSASVAFENYVGLARGAANILAQFAPEHLRRAAVEKLYGGDWGGTMCLTEAGAGSSVGDNRARALPTAAAGVYELEGEKVFITAGDHDLTENIIHLVLARTPAAAPGTKGLSIFMVPKFLFDGSGALGERNGAFVTRVEEKMGIHGSATCTLVLGDGKRCLGYLLGNEFDGMRIMFQMMNEARLGVGIQGLAASAAAYNSAVAYAKERIQGVPVEKMRDATAERVPIVRHPDVRRMLMWQKVHVEAMRSLLYSTALRFDVAESAADKAVAEQQLGIAELLTPICKAYCSDRGFESTVLALQTYGGYGYMQEFPVEQYVRDAKIASIYEGTNGIQAMDLLGRKLQQGGGALLRAWLGGCTELLSKARALGGLETEVSELEKARDNLGASAMHLGGLAMKGEIAAAMVHATPFLNQFGGVELGMQALRQAVVAQEAMAAGAAGDDLGFYRGKVANVRFYCAQVLPATVAAGKSIRSGDTSCLDEVLFR
ncbi:MAG: acyl-CoA dehydrogenase [Candidatus Schekmanbacteria bacterium]|nr:acyl-CoA dehydrogenase [Candidatus Schekmanbacteria bacterium]